MDRHRFDDVRRVAETDSTNTRLLELARAGGPAGVVLVADHQSAGRGRLGRRWEAPPGSALLVSVLLRPELALGRAHLLSMAAALAASDACDALAGLRPPLKWPNDLVVEEAQGTLKLAGLLAESLVDGGELRAVVLGMGLNIDAAPAEGAAALNDHREPGRPPVGRDALLASWLAHLSPWLDGLESVLAAYRPRCSTLGRPVRVELADRSFEGRALDVTDDGHLLVETADGVREVTVGDVVHVRVTDRGPSPAGP
ncbi:MAG: biotin--[acetyl-CoA-carboxylase] ligase [Actinomycetota bacterium]|nr:biotin--[acetyl-CoA-carboxylase] ligase [Actinomycetota bacterium]